MIHSQNEYEIQVVRSRRGYDFNVMLNGTLVGNSYDCAFFEYEGALSVARIVARVHAAEMRLAQRRYTH